MRGCTFAFGLTPSMPVMVKLKETSGFTQIRQKLTSTEDVLKVLVQLLELFANDRLSSA